MPTPTISVIIPVYNTEPYLAKCLDSILAQTFADFEALLIDDGSPDQAGNICDQYARRDTRIRVFHQANAGVSAARQLGLDNARGEYVIHADSDDWVEPQMLQALYAEATRTCADVVICDYLVHENGGVYYFKQEPPALDRDSILRALLGNLHGSCCNKLARRELYSRYGVRFPVGVNFCEDLHTWIQLYLHDVSTAYLPQAFYHYVYRRESLVQGYTPQTYRMRCAFRDEVCRLLPAEGYEAEKRRLRYNALFEGFRHHALPDAKAWRELWREHKRAALLCRKDLRGWAVCLCMFCGAMPLARFLLTFQVSTALRSLVGRGRKPNQPTQ